MSLTLNGKQRLHVSGTICNRLQAVVIYIYIYIYIKTYTTGQT